MFQNSWGFQHLVVQGIIIMRIPVDYYNYVYWNLAKDNKRLK